MDLVQSGFRWESHDFRDDEIGVAGLVLVTTCTFTGKRVEAARISYWDAEGQFFVRTIDGYDLPVRVLYAALIEAKGKFAPWLKGDGLPEH